MTFNHSEWTLLISESEKMARIGFVYEPFGDLSIVIREVPLAFHTPSTERFFKELVDGLERLKLSSEEIWKDRIIKAACKAAIKANDKMDAFEVKRLLADLKVLKDPYTCPHGRPIIVTITQSEFEKMFKRT
jgi:DNA mismatch repair protein MutL